MENLFAKWELDFQATSTEIRQAYRRRAQKMHPDRRPPAEQNQAQEEFCRLQEEYALLQDPVRRQRHIEELAEKASVLSPAPPSSVSNDVQDPSPPVPSELSSSWFVPSGPINLTCRVPLKHIARGATMSLIFPCSRPCVCMRTYRCRVCQGTGVVRFAKKIQIRLPVGLRNHAVLSFPAQGHEGTHDIGTLYLHVKWSRLKGWKEVLGRPYGLEKVVRLPPWEVHRVWVKSPSGAVGYVRWPEEKKDQPTLSVFLSIGFSGESVLVKCIHAPWWQAPWWWGQQTWWFLQNLWGVGMDSGKVMPS